MAINSRKNGEVTIAKPINPFEIAQPTVGEVKLTLTILKVTHETLFQGWGFCHKTCHPSMDIFSTELRMVRLTTLPEDLCSKFGTIFEQNKVKMVVNPKVKF